MVSSIVKRNAALKWAATSLLNWQTQTAGASMLSWPGLPREVFRFLRARRAYGRLCVNRGETVLTYPILFQKGVMPFDAHYTYQAVWAMQRIAHRAPLYHVDVSSDLRFVTQLSVTVPVIYVEWRTTQVSLRDTHHLRGDLLRLPYARNSLVSLSCLHVIEHVGLGRYGDALDIDGPRKALDELQRVLAPGGSLLVSTPVGQARTLFNAHRVFAPDAIPEAMSSLQMLEFSAVTTKGAYLENMSPLDFSEEGYACGLYRFTKQ